MRGVPSVQSTPRHGIVDRAAKRIAVVKQEGVASSSSAILDAKNKQIRQDRAALIDALQRNRVLRQANPEDPILRAQLLELLKAKQRIKADYRQLMDLELSYRKDMERKCAELREEIALAKSLLTEEQQVQLAQIRRKRTAGDRES